MSLQALPPMHWTHGSLCTVPGGVPDKAVPGHRHGVCCGRRHVRLLRAQQGVCERQGKLFCYAHLQIMTPLLEGFPTSKHSCRKHCPSHLSSAALAITPQHRSMPAAQSKRSALTLQQSATGAGGGPGALVLPAADRRAGLLPQKGHRQPRHQAGGATNSQSVKFCAEAACKPCGTHTGAGPVREAAAAACKIPAAPHIARWTTWSSATYNL
jgi:hypothetical protein